MQFQDLNWFDVENYLKTDDRLIIVLGSCEQHGYLSLLTDTRIPMALANAASQKTGVLVAPGVNFGISPYFLGYPGTLSLRTNTMLDLLEDLISSAHQHGFARILVLNGHGGNEPARGRLYEMLNRFDDLKLAWYAWWQSHSIEAIAMKHDLKPTHANWLEAFSFNRVAELPKGQKAPPHGSGILNADEVRQVYGDGVFGGPYQVGESIMDEIFEAALMDVLKLLEFQA